jgi:AP-4 complex subunit epsilon-1
MILCPVGSNWDFLKLSWTLFLQGMSSLLKGVSEALLFWSCLQVDRNLSFLNEFVESTAANGARLYIPESEHSDMCTTVITGIHDQLEPSAHALRFEAYEVAKVPSPPIAAAASSFPSFEEQKKPESPRSLRTHLAANSGFDTVSFNPDITRLWLDGVQKKWGQSSSRPPQLSSSSPSGLDKKGDNWSIGVTAERGSPHREAAPVSSFSTEPVTVSKSSSGYSERKKPQPEISSEKQRLAASLFGGPTPSGRTSGSAGAKVAPTRAGAVSQPSEKHLPSHPSSGGSKPKVSDAAGSSKQIVVPTIPAAAPVDLLDMSDSVSGVITSGPGDDAFKQLEGLLEGPVTTAAAATPAPPQKPTIDLMSLHNSNSSTTPYETLVVSSVPDLVSITAPTASGVESFLTCSGFPGLMDLVGLSPSSLVGPPLVQGQADKPVSQLKKGPSCQDSLQKDAASWQVGVTPTGTNPALFQDLFG